MSRRPSYTTPEGFSIARPLELPDVRRFDEILTYVRPWDSALMSHRNDKIARPDLVPDKVDIAAVTIYPYCRIDLSATGGPRHEVAVTVTGLLEQALVERPFLVGGEMSFRVISHQKSNRALVIGTQVRTGTEIWIAYVDVGTVPASQTDL